MDNDEVVGLIAAVEELRELLWDSAGQPEDIRRELVQRSSEAVVREAVLSIKVLRAHRSRLEEKLESALAVSKRLQEERDGLLERVRRALLGLDDGAACDCCDRSRSGGAS